MKVEVAFFILGALLPGVSRGLIFREDQFTDMTQECLKSDGKPLRHILNADNPAMYISVDGNHDIKKFKRAERTRLFKKITNDQFNQKHLLQDLADGRSQWLNDLKFIQDLQSGSSSSSSDSAQRKVDHHKNQGNFLKGIVIWSVAARSVVQSPVRALDSNLSNTFFFISTFTPFQLLQIMLAICI